MTGSLHADVDITVAAWTAGNRESVIAAVQGNAELAAHIAAEVTRIETPGHRNLLDPKNGDPVSQRMYEILKAIQAAAA